MVDIVGYLLDEFLGAIIVGEMYFKVIGHKWVGSQGASKVLHQLHVTKRHTMPREIRNAPQGRYCWMPPSGVYFHYI